MNQLVTRSTKCSDLTPETFAKYMMEDMVEAKKQYDNIWYDAEYALYLKNLENAKSWAIKVATKYAEKHWKTEKKRNEYIQKYLEKNLKHYEFKYHSISYFDFDVRPWDNGISGNCILSYDNMTKEAMIRCFNEIKDNKYFKGATGWVLEDNYRSRPQIKLILDDKLAKEFKEDKENLAKAIADFYRGCTYFGD